MAAAPAAPQARAADGSAGDVDYAAHGTGYGCYRRPEPAIAKMLWEHLGIEAGKPCRVVNVGAGAGSYEPEGPGIEVVPVEPSASMRAQRPPNLPPAVDAAAEALPFPDAGFDAAMGSFTVHQWRDLAAGLAEMRRVTKAGGRIVLLTCDPEGLGKFWLAEYTPSLVENEVPRFPSLRTLVEGLGGDAEVVEVPIPLNCGDGFVEAYYGRPEMFLDEGARRAQSSWSFVTREEEQRCVDALRRDLESGEWDRKHGHLRRTAEWVGSLRLVVARQ
ncbi:methylase [Hyaloraphidium curvatum]|nr:methylase [Hyaloraphidium curvatum]